MPFRAAATALLALLFLARPSHGQIITRPIDPGGGGVLVPPPGGGGPGGGGVIGIPINPINPINPGGGGAVPTGPRIVTDAGMLSGQSSQASVVLPATPAPAASGQGSGTTPATLYQWTISGGRITSDPTQQSVAFTADTAGTVALNVVVGSGTAAQSTSAEVTVLSPALAGAISSPATARTNAPPVAATVPAAQNGDRTFRWSVSGTGAAIASGQGTNAVTVRPGSPGLLEVMCDVTLQRLATVTLRSFVMVNGDGPPAALTVNQGAGGGTHPAGSRVDIFADPPASGQVFDRWVGDTGTLGNAALAASSPHAIVTLPATGATLTATYKSAAPWTPTVVNGFNPIAASNPSGATLTYHIPAQARALVFLLHENGGAAQNWFSRPEHLTLARDLVAANFGVAALNSANRVVGTWSAQASLAANPDAATIAAAIDRFTREGLLTATTPVFLLGVAGGGDAAARYGQMLAGATPARSIAGVVLYCATGGTMSAATSRVPQFFALAAHDDALGSAGMAEARENSQLLAGRGIATAVISNTASPVPAARLRSLGLNAPAFSTGDAQAIHTALKTAGMLDANNYPKSVPTVDAVRTILPAAHQARAADVVAQLAVAYAAQEFFSDANARVITFLNGRVANAATPPPGRLVNLSTRTQIAYLGDTFTLGFTLTGPQRATVLIRGVGPGLARFGVRDPLPALRLEVARSGAVISSNEGWDRAGNAAEILAAGASVGAFALTRGDLDTAVLLTLDPGAYTASIKSINGAVGATLAEVYDVSKNATRLTNLSALAKVGQDGEFLLPGIAIAGNNPRTLLVRAVGPGLAELGLAADSLLDDPRLVIMSSNGQPVAANNNWTQTDPATLNAVFSRVGAFPLRNASSDAALVNALPPGNYIVQATAAPFPAGTTTVLPNTAGTVLVEVYEVP